jgi:hypothetical protein
MFVQVSQHRLARRGDAEQALVVPRRIEEMALEWQTST